MPLQMGIGTKPLGSGNGLGGLTPAEEASDCGWMMKEKSIGSILSLVPGLISPKMIKDRHTFGNKQEISEASLSEGFTFPLRDPPRPGQFTNIPQHGLFTKPQSSLPPEPNRDLPSSPSKNRITDSTARASPLDLPEICLPGKSRDVDIAHAQGGEAEVSQRDRLESRFFMSPGMTKPIDVSGSQGCSPKDADETDKTSRLLSPPKLTSSPTQSRHNDLFKAIDHKVATEAHDDAYHAPQKRSVKKTKSSNTQRQSTPSVCGDLELPTYRSPVRSRHQHPKDFACRPMIYSSTKGHEQRSHRRSGSNTSSNISKKRSRGHKPLLMPDPERMRWAMDNVARSWNECLQIREEQALEANDKAKKLEHDLKLQEKELKKADELLNQKDIELHKIEELYNTLVESNTRVTRENNGLASELKSLREQLSEEKEQGKVTNDKYDTYRHKLNETIREQGVLFRRAQTYYQDTMDELREENARKTASSDAIDKALKNSLKIRDEMKKCTEEYRMQMDKDVQKKDQVILELKEKLKLQEALLAQEKLFADKLRAHAEEQDIAYQCVQALEVKVDSLMAHHAIQNERRESDVQQTTQMMSMLNSKLDSLRAGGSLLASKMLSQENLELKLAAAEKNIVKSMLPAIFSLENGHSDAANAISQLGASIGRDLDHFKGEVSQMMDALDQNEEGNNRRFQELLRYMQTFEGSLKKGENSCEDMGQKLDTLAGSGQSNQRDTINMLQNLLQRISAREINANDTERQFQQAGEELSKKVEAMISEAMNKGDETTDLVRSAAAELQTALERGLGQEREKTTQLLQGNENILKALTAHIDEQKQLTTQTGHRTSELQATLEIEREASAHLKCKIQGLEQKAQETENLRGQWLKDVQNIAQVRSQLKAIEVRIPQVENCDRKLDRIVEISRSIQSSASYLATEKEWVQLELAGVMPKPAALEPIASCEITTTPLSLFAESNGVADIPSSTREDTTSRKVTVHSPDPGEESPSPPLTVMQEQKRRREITQLRSILKSHADSGAVEVSSVDGHSARPQANHSKANQLSSCSLNKSQSASAREMVAEIRSGLLQHDWAFPTVADFERDIQATTKKRQAPQSNPVSLESSDASHRDMKKLKTGYDIE